jgi:2-polyprenyl-6-hydroxyphenyl methylase/3-demethylubiquinone-9 3-methyltransferase
MTAKELIDGFRWENAEHTCAHNYLLPAFERIINKIGLIDIKQNVFDLGCGNGAFAAWLSSRGWEVVGVDPSTEGIAHANKHFPALRLEKGSAYDDLAGRYGQFPLVVSLEVIEHVYSPRDYARTLFSLVQPGGKAIISTPYHGYVKNLALALSGKMDQHFTALWDHGHIKFWSIKTLRTLLMEQGFVEIAFYRVGRVPPLAKSMIAVATRRDAD